MKRGIAGTLAGRFIASPLVPVILIASVFAGITAYLTIPREEAPSFHVPLVDIIVSADGLKASDAVELITKPLEEGLRGLPGIEHVYSTTTDNQVLVSVRFATGTREDDAVLRVNNRIQANLNRLPIGIPAPMVVGHGVDDVSVLNLTLTPIPAAAPYWDAGALSQLAAKLQTELIKNPDVAQTTIAGDDPEQLRIEPDPEKLMLYGVTLQQLVARVRLANASFTAGSLRLNGVMEQVDAGQSLSDPGQIGLLLITTSDGRPVYLADIARIIVGPAPATHGVWAFTRQAGQWVSSPAVTIGIAKRAGANSVTLSQTVLAQVAALQGKLIPPDIAVQVTRDDGQTAQEKSAHLLVHLAIATVSIVVLIALAIGLRAALVTAIVIPTVILLTIFGADLMGFTLNPVTFFALIFSVGILVDDIIVVVENISRHWAMHDGRPRGQAAVDAVDEVGNPSIVATLAVIIALLPMLFISGLMGPYMASIPVNASVAMLISFAAAVMVVPWLMMKLAGHAAAHEDGGAWLGVLYQAIARPILHSRARALSFLLSIGILTLLIAFSLFYFEAVKVKLMPLENKTQFDVLVNLPPGAALEDTERALFAAARIAGAMPEVVSMQAYAGTAQPADFTGLVRHYDARQSPELGVLHIVLTDPASRARTSHHIAEALREALAARLALPPGGAVKVVETNPGPPVQAMLVAEIYGPDAATRRQVATRVEQIFKSIPYIVDADNSYGLPRPAISITADQDRLQYFGVQQSDVDATLNTLFNGATIGYDVRGAERPPLEIRVALPASSLTWDAAMAATPVPGAQGNVELGELVSVRQTAGSTALYRRDGHFADLVTGEMAGAFEAPVYGILAVDHAIAGPEWGALPRPAIRYAGQPMDESTPSLLWDGEWEPTYVTFRDLGRAFIIALLGIYILVVGLFASLRLPLVVLTPIPLTLIGITLGHWMLHANFTATSMIGFIALAGIIVRNSILLVDFIRRLQHTGLPLRDVLLQAGAIRVKPILLTALAAMISAVTILPDAAFQGLGVSLLFGVISSTFLTLLVIPAIYIVLRDNPQPVGWVARREIHRFLDAKSKQTVTFFKKSSAKNF